MLSLYLLDQPVRIFLLVLVYIGILAQLGSVIFTWYLQKDRRRIWRIIFESFIFLHFFVLCLSLSVIQVQSLSAQLTAPYLALRFALMIAPLSGVPLLFEERQNSDALAMIALIFTLPFMENIFGSEYYLSLIFSTMLLLLRAIAQVSQLRAELNTSITRVAMKEAFDSFPQPLAIGLQDGRIDLMNSAMRKLILELELAPKDIKGLEELLLAKADLHEGPPRVYALSHGDCVYHVQGESFAAPHRKYRILILNDISDEADLINELKLKNSELIHSNEQMEAILAQTEDIIMEREKTRLRNRIHDVMGQRLSILHLYIQQMEEGKAPPLTEITELLDSMLEDLSKSANTEVTATVDQIRDAAQLVGVQFSFIGKLPTDPKRERLILNIMREAVTNAIRHAQAKNIKASLVEKTDECILSISNDGRPPLLPISEGDGLKGMRFQLEQIGGSLELPHKLPFELRAVIPKLEAESAK
ncbi:MAG: hypothetical protein Q4P08_05405 [Eubacteriales bacterium]|nr:hypothetical protein [Eubacteriales bacterium]